MRNPIPLNEEYYQALIRKFDPNWLPHRDYSPLIPFVKFSGHKGNTMKFFVPNRYNGWNTYVRFSEWAEVRDDRDYNAAESARLLLWGANLKVFCGCPAFQFYGYNYILTQKDAAIVPEDRPPNIRNPHLKGIACKHLIKTLKVLPFHLGDMARNINQQRILIDQKA